MNWDPYTPTLDMDEVVRLALDMFNATVPVFCAGSGGGCATIYVGWPYVDRSGAYDTDCWAVLGGCGALGSPNWAWVEEFSVGYDQDQDDVHSCTFPDPNPRESRELRAAQTIFTIYQRHPKAIWRDEHKQFHSCATWKPLSFDELEAAGYDTTLRGMS